MTAGARELLLESTFSLREHYERLREAVLAKRPSSGCRFGLGVLINRGVVAWLQITAQSLVATSTRLTPTISSKPMTLPEVLHEDLLHLMEEAVLTVAGAAR